MHFIHLSKKRARMVVVLDPVGWVAERAPRTLLVADRHPSLWALHVCVCDGEGICTPTPSWSRMSAWRTEDRFSGTEKRSMRKEHAQQSRWCRHS